MRDSPLPPFFLGELTFFLQKIPVQAVSQSQNPHWRGEISLCGVDGTKGDLYAHKDALLHPQEHHVFELLHYDRRRYSYLLGRYSAKGALAGASGSTNGREFWIQNGVLGEPCVEGSPFSLSIAHADTWGIAVAGPQSLRLGIDVESKDRFHKPILELLRSPEYDRVRSIATHDADAQGILWTAKESLAKCLGIGFSTPLRIFEVGDLAHRGSVYSVKFTNFPTHQGYVWSLNGIWMALCLGCACVLNVQQTRIGEGLFSNSA